MYDHRFQRTDQWMPVYAWLESLDTDEVIKSKDVVDWLTANPHIRDHLYSRHSRYHLMHYIKKCHVKILKRKEKQLWVFDLGWMTRLRFMEHNAGLIVAKIPLSKDHNVEDKAPGSPNGNNVSSMPKDSELYKAKRSEALRKYEILVEFEKQLIPLFGKREN
ncbi:hypothetical protein PHJA_002080700 [Phtheirospermum japonicum]|uniref:Uncharacterized protein n=1 Tax=Phtheirospermum japonicum TaxID=374723 RepID=A0A830CJ87_9LAMI|nr:hypothetical protein PHJA_002080700 [Phtheirospermum japonicum]